MGFYAASPGGIAAFVDDRGGAWGGGDDEILFHEIAHHFMLQYRPMAYPAWFVEGFAEYVMTAQIKGTTIDFGRPSATRVSWLKNVRWLPMERVLFGGSGGPRNERALFYAQSWLVAHYLMRDEGRREKFKAYVAALNRGVPAREAFTAQFGDVKAFGGAVEAYARRGMTYSRLTRLSAKASPAIRVETLPPSAEELLPAEAALYVGQRGDYAAKILAKVRAEAARHPGDGYARRVLATAEVLHGDPAKGEALLDELLKASPNEAAILYLKGMRHLLAGRSDPAKKEAHFKAARPWFVKAHKADPNHWQTLARYGESLTTESRFGSENTMNILLKAQQLAPQVVELTMNAANLLLIRGHAEEAEALVLPLASHPHNVQLAADAQALVERARAAKKAPARPAGE
jgi:Flp pilus assembly protein TadD